MSQAELEAMRQALLHAFALCGWEALLVCPSFRITLPIHTHYRMYAGPPKETP